MAEKSQWCPRRPRIIIQVCICIYVCVSKHMIDLMCAQSLCVCVFVHVTIMYGRVGGWSLDGLCLALAGLSEPLLYDRCTLLHPKQAMWREAISTLASNLGFPLIRTWKLFRFFDLSHSITHSPTKTANERESKRVRRKALCNQINGCLWGWKLT